MPIRCVIVDDNSEFLEVARAVLEAQGSSVVGVAATGAEAFREVETAHPDVALVDIFLGDDSGIELSRRLVANGAAVILISSHAEADLEDLIATSPATGFLTKTDLSADAICRILGGHSG